MLKWLLILGVLVAMGYQTLVSFRRLVPSELEDGDRVAVLDTLGSLGNSVLLTAARFGLDLAAYKPVKVVVDSVYSLLLNGMFPGHYKDIEVRDSAIADVPVRLFIPRKQKTPIFPAMIYLHGGGWSWLSVEVYSRFLSHLSNATNLMIVAVRYRQAPSHVYPLNLDDCRRVTWSVLAGKSGLPIHTGYVIIGGDEAGGNMAASLALEFRAKIYMQILLNPKLQMFDFLTPSYQDHQSFLTGVTSSARSAVDWLRYTGRPVSWYPALLNNAHRFPSQDILKHQTFLNSKTYLPPHLQLTEAESAPAMAYDSTAGRGLKEIITSESISPAIANNIRGVPNAYIVTSQYDIYRDEAVMYINRLHQDGGSEVKLKHYKQAFHGFFPFAGNKSWFQFKVSDQALQELVEFISYQVHRVMKHSAAS